MIRPLTLLSMAAAAGAGLYLYQVKHSVAQLDRELRGINRQTEQARERTQVLRAEWALLNEPDRLRQVAQRHLQLEAMTAAQFVRPAEMERRLPPPRQFAGTPSLFASVEPAGDGSATAIALAPAGTRPPATAEAMASAPAAPTTPGPALLPAAIASAAAAAPAAAATAEASRPAVARVAAAPRPAPTAPPGPVQPAMHVERPVPAIAAQRVAAPAGMPTVTSSLGGNGPSLAPPIPVARAAAATLPGAR
jgi:hypothetical protein